MTKFKTCIVRTKKLHKSVSKLYQQIENVKNIFKSLPNRFPADHTSAKNSICRTNPGHNEIGVKFLFFHLINKLVEKSCLPDTSCTQQYNDFIWLEKLTGIFDVFPMNRHLY
ncbi:hypothetical protein B1H10_07055 [candidate division KSB1 bacterium 4484_188]|nr:MAG: hypothetical protein B1H10_07055 [candidate division KSB1 bacterium 4484_188]